MTTDVREHDPGAGAGVAPAGAAGGTRRALVVCELWLGSDGYAGLRALRRAGWNALAVPEWEFVPVRWRRIGMKVLARLVRALAAREFNDELLRNVDKFRPELLLVFKGTFVRGETLRRLRERGVRCYCFYPDVSFRAHGRYIPRALPQYDWVFTTKSFGIRDMREQLGVTRSSLILFAFDPDLHRPVELTDQDRARFGCDVSYIGTWSPKKEALLGALVERRPDLDIRVWGEQWHKATAPSLRRVIAGHEVTSEDFVRAVCASSINLSIMSERRAGSSSGDRIANRTFTVPACGAFVLHERTEEVLSIFREDDEIVCFSDVDEMVRKIDEFLPDEARRREIAERARSLVLAKHSWDERIRSILAHHASLRTGAVPGRREGSVASSAGRP